MLFQFINETHTFFANSTDRIRKYKFKGFFSSTSQNLSFEKDLFTKVVVMTPENTHILIIPAAYIGTS